MISSLSEGARRRALAARRRPGSLTDALDVLEHLLAEPLLQREADPLRGLLDDPPQVLGLHPADEA